METPLCMLQPDEQLVQGIFEPGNDRKKREAFFLHNLLACSSLSSIIKVLKNV